MQITLTNVFGSFNRGDALLLEALHGAIRDVFGHQAILSGIAHFPELENKHLPDVQWFQPPGRSYANLRWLRRLENALNTVAILGYSKYPKSMPWPIAIPPKKQRAGLDAIRNADLVVSSAGGFLLDVNVSIYGNLLQLHFAKQSRKPVLLAPQTIGPIKSARLRRLTKSVLDKCDLICARESHTFDFLTDVLGIPAAKVRRTTDLAFEHQSNGADESHKALSELGIDPSVGFIGASVVDWAFPSSADPTQSRLEYEEKMIHCLRTLAVSERCPVLLVNQVSSDLKLAKRVADRASSMLPDVRVIADTTDRSTSTMRGIINKSKAFLGSRFHSCLFALLEGVPTTALAYTYKTNGIMEDLKMSDCVFDIASFHTTAVVDQVQRHIADRAAIQNRIETAIENLPYPKFATILNRFAEIYVVGMDSKLGKK